MTLLAQTTLDELLRRVKPLRVGVLGDFAIDAYWHADMTRSLLSRETPLHVRPVVREAYSAGAGANVARLVALLGAEVEPFSVIGADWRGDLLVNLLAEANVGGPGLIRSPQVSTVMFGKVILEAPGLCQEDPRVDFVNSRSVQPEAESQLLAVLDERLAGLDLLLLTDYEPMGVVSPGLRQGLLDRTAGIPHVVADSRVHISDFPSCIRKPNLHEANAWWDLPPSQSPDVRALAREAHRHRGNGPLFVTLGIDGCLVADGEGEVVVPTVPIGHGDPVGAGDAFLAAVGLALAGGTDARTAAAFANLAAAATVRSIGATGTLSPESLKELNGCA